MRSLATVSKVYRRGTSVLREVVDQSRGPIKQEARRSPLTPL